MKQSSITRYLGKLSKDIDEPNDILWNSKPRQIPECTIEQLQHIITHYLLAANNIKFEKLISYRSKIMLKVH